MKMKAKTQEKRLKPPFNAGEAKIHCPLPLVKQFNPVSIEAYCHCHAGKNQLCHHAGDCEAYLDYLVTRLNHAILFGVKVSQEEFAYFEKFGLNPPNSIKQEVKVLG